MRWEKVSCMQTKQHENKEPGSGANIVPRLIPPQRELEMTSIYEKSLY